MQIQHQNQRHTSPKVGPTILISFSRLETVILVVSEVFLKYDEVEWFDCRAGQKSELQIYVAGNSLSLCCQWLSFVLLGKCISFWEKVPDSKMCRVYIYLFSVAYRQDSWPAQSRLSEGERSTVSQIYKCAFWGSPWGSPRGNIAYITWRTASGCRSPMVKCWKLRILIRGRSRGSSEASACQDSWRFSASYFFSTDSWIFVYHFVGPMVENKIYDWVLKFWKKFVATAKSATKRRM